MSKEIAARFARLDSLDHSHRDGGMSAAHQHITNSAVILCLHRGEYLI